MNFKWITIILVAALVSLGCAKQEKAESRNMEQIYKEEGIPVEVQVIQHETFIKELAFNTNLSGIRQSAAAAMIGGRIEKVNVKVGDYVEKGQVMFEFPEDAPAGQLIQARSAFELAESTYKRMKNLYEKGGISKQDLDRVETQFKVAEANLDAVMQMLKVRAPIDGYVIAVNVRETDGVHAEDVLAFVSQTKQMKARIWATEDEVCQIMKEQKATAIWNNVTLSGKVTEVSISMDRSHNAFGVDLVFDNTENLCKSNVVGDIAIQVYKNEDALLVERANVKKDANGYYVYKLNSDIAHKAYVKTGKENGHFEITSGLEISDKVIIKGLNLVYDGAKVKIVTDGK